MRPEPRDPLLLSDGHTPEMVGNNAAVFRHAFMATLARLKAMHKRIFVIGPVPEVDHIVPDTLAQLAASNDSRAIAPTREQFNARERNVFPILYAAQETDGVIVLYPHARLCDAQRCPVEADGRALYFDNNHLSTFGAKRIAPFFDSVFVK
jgi:hypothetical protein